MYSLDSGITFDPYDLSVDITPDSIGVALNNGHYSNALMMSFKLNEKELISKSLEAVPTADSKQNNSNSRIQQALLCRGQRSTYIIWQ